jgi:hypothetical protein
MFCKTDETCIMNKKYEFLDEVSVYTVLLSFLCDNFKYKR